MPNRRGARDQRWPHGKRRDARAARAAVAERPETGHVQGIRRAAAAASAARCRPVLAPSQQRLNEWDEGRQEKQRHDEPLGPRAKTRFTTGCASLLHLEEKAAPAPASNAWSGA